jgi:hypothetical protein
MVSKGPVARSFSQQNIGKPVDLPPESEEVAGFFAAMLDTDHAKNETFQNNFFKDWLAVLKEFPPVRCDLTVIINLILSFLTSAMESKSKNLQNVTSAR